MNRLHLFGTNHKIVPPKELGLLPPAHELERELANLKAEGLIAGSVLLSTCNRFELYLEAPAEQDTLLPYLPPEIRQRLQEIESFHLQGLEAARHLIRVAGSLESMVLGENQILAQVKQAWQRAQQGKLTTTMLDEAFRQALQGAKEVRSCTGLGTRPVSVASIGVRELTEHLRARGLEKGARIALIGAGEMIRKAAPALVTALEPELTFINRDPNKATVLCEQYGGDTLPLRSFLADGAELDAIIIAVRCEFPLLDEEIVDQIRSRTQAPLTIVDLSVPGMVSAAPSPELEILDMDHLKAQSEANEGERRIAAKKAEPIAEYHSELLAQRVREKRLDLGSVRNHHLDLAEQQIETMILKDFAHLNAVDQDKIRHLVRSLAKSHAHIHLKDLRQQLVGAAS
jgi:glutamyl-tRNA reductase